MNHVVGYQQQIEAERHVVGQAYPNGESQQEKSRLRDTETRNRRRNGRNQSILTTGTEYRE